MTEIVAELSGVLYDKLSRTSRPVHLKVKGNAMAIDAGGPGDPPGIWGPTDPRPGWGLPEPPGGGGDAGAHPEHPIVYPPGIWGPTDPRPGWGLPGGGDGKPPGIWGPTDPRPGPPIYLPPEQVPPNMKPPSPPPAGTTAPVPPPAGSGGWPTSGIVPPEYVVFNYPGVGPIYVAPPPHAEPAA